MIDDTDGIPPPSIDEIVGWFDPEYQDACRQELEAAQEITRACYQTGSYEGEWVVEWIDKNGVPQSNSGSHCSCNGPTW